MSSRTSPQTGVAIPKGFRNIQGIATPVYALARNDTLISGNTKRKSPKLSAYSSGNSLAMARW